MAGHARQAIGRKAAGGKPLRLRPARPADLEALIQLEQTCFTGDRMSRRAFRHALQNPRARLLVVEEAPSRLLAAALVLRRADTSAARLYSIAVHPAARGRGLAASLLRRLERDAQKSGATELRLEVSAGNHAALALYRESGYEESGRIPGYYEDGTDALRLRRFLAV